MTISRADSVAEISRPRDHNLLIYIVLREARFRSDFLDASAERARMNPGMQKFIRTS